MKRLIGCVALLCLAALMASCGGGAKSGTLAYVSNSTGTGFTVFSVNTDGSLSPASISPITTPAPPKVIQFSPNGRWAYFLDAAGSNIFAFTRAGNGSLATHIDTFPVSGGASSLVITPNSKFLYVALPGALSGELAIYSIDQSTGILSQVGSNLLLGYQISQLLVSPNGDVLYALAPAQHTVLTFTIQNTNSGVLTGPNTFSVGPNPPQNGMILSANGSFLYVLDQTQTGIQTTNGQVNGTGVTVSGQSPTIFAFLTSSTGNLQPIGGSPFHENANLAPLGKTPPEAAQFPTDPIAGVTSNDSRFLFVVNQGSHNISVFCIGPSSCATTSNPGELTEVTGSVTSVNGVPTSTASPFDCGCTEPGFIAISKNNNAIYVLNEGQLSVPQAQNAVFQFSVDQTTGRLRPFSPASLDLGTNTSPTWITIR
jgi:6-phosphogluconolactonase (cycloisomerase 2 family)